MKYLLLWRHRHAPMYGDSHIISYQKTLYPSKINKTQNLPPVSCMSQWTMLPFTGKKLLADIQCDKFTSFAHGYLIIFFCELCNIVTGRQISQYRSVPDYSMVRNCCKQLRNPPITLIHTLLPPPKSSLASQLGANC